MPRIIAQFTNLKYDIEGHKKKVHEALQVQMRQAAREWLRAAIPLVPVYSGMARASLRPRARGTPGGRADRSPGPAHGPPQPRPRREQQRFSFTDDGVRYYFQWTTDVLHYQLNEYYTSRLKLTHPTPWESTEAGNVAFRKYAYSIAPKRLPAIKNYLIFGINRTARV